MTYKHPILDNKIVKKAVKLIKGFPKYYKIQERKQKWLEKD